jgi:hypothetical protein
VPVTAAETKIDSTLVSVCCTALESFTERVNEEVPVAVGVPVISPVEAFRARPAGKDPEPIDQV